MFSYTKEELLDVSLIIEGSLTMASFTLDSLLTLVLSMISVLVFC